MSPQDVIGHFDGIPAVSRALGITGEAVRYWVKTGFVPLGRQYEIQFLTGGRLMAERNGRNVSIQKGD